MSLDNLYSQIILDYNKNPKNFHKLKDFSDKQECYNPVCGDQFTVFLKLSKNNLIEDISFIGVGCAISKASASMMTEILLGKTLNEAKIIIDEFMDLVNNKKVGKNLGDLEIFSGIWKYPSRTKCATLSWHGIKAILKSN